MPISVLQVMVESNSYISQFWEFSQELWNSLTFLFQAIIAVQKRLLMLQKGSLTYKVLLTHKNAPLGSELSPAEHLYDELKTYYSINQQLTYKQVSASLQTNSF